MHMKTFKSYVLLQKLIQIRMKSCYQNYASIREKKNNEVEKFKKKKTMEFID